MACFHQKHLYITLQNKYFVTLCNDLCKPDGFILHISHSTLSISLEKVNYSIEK
jgi:hypothetical protein